MTDLTTPQHNRDSSGYDAFISYSRRDTAFAKALEKALEDFRPPKDLDVNKEPLDIFRDENDLTGTEYFQSIDGHLKNSKKLLVLCSPNSRKSEFVNDEIRRFVKANDAKNVIPVIISGVPDNEATAAQEDEKAFPPALFESMEVPLAKDYRDFNPAKDKANKSPYETSWYGILAEIYDKSRREIEERDRKKLARQRRIRTGIVAGVMAALASLTVFAWIQREEARAQRDEAQRQLAMNYWENSRTVRDQQVQAWEGEAPRLALHLAAEATRLIADEALLADILLDMDRSAWLDIFHDNEYVLKSLMPKVFQHSAAIKGAELSRDGRRILTWGDNGTARLWHVETGKQIGPGIKMVDDDGIINRAFFDQAGKRILTLGSDDTARLWQAETGSQIGRSMKHDDGVSGAVIDQNGKRILTWDSDGSARLWNAETGTQTGPGMKVKLKDDDGTVAGAMFDQVGKHILIWGTHHTVRLWQAETGRQIGLDMNHDYGVVDGAMFDQAGKRILTWGADHTARLWQAETGKQLGKSMEHGAHVGGAVFDEAEKRILTWSYGDSTARLWQIETGKQLGNSMKHNQVLGAMFDQSGKRILTWSENGVVLLHDLEVDLDFPARKYAIEVQVLTRSSFNELAKEVEILDGEDWRLIYNEYMQLARNHYQVCRYPRANHYRWLNPEEATEIRTLDE